MPIIKKIWRDNTMPPTNYIWMKLNLNKELIGIYEWYNGKWHPIEISPTDKEYYTKSETDSLLEYYSQYTEQEIIRKIASGEYEIDVHITIDDHLDANSENPVQNKVIKDALDRKWDKQELISIPSDDYPWN